MREETEEKNIIALASIFYLAQVVVLVFISYYFFNLLGVLVVLGLVLLEAKVQILPIYGFSTLLAEKLVLYFVGRRNGEGVDDDK